MRRQEMQEMQRTLGWAGTGLFTAILAAAGLAGCQNYDTGVCTPGEEAACACPGGAEAVQVCLDDGSGWDTCQCCQPDCLGRVCGLDPSCGTSCGACDAGEACTPLGRCAPVCVPDCDGRECGPDPVCGVSCGTCTEPYEVCMLEVGMCGSECRDCGDRECGAAPNGCGYCGELGGDCPTGERCDSLTGMCEPDCDPDCGARVCGPDPVCGVSCGTCPAGETCDGGGVCTGDGPCCEGRECGPDPCGFSLSCGTCPAGNDCSALGVCQAEATQQPGEPCTYGEVNAEAGYCVAGAVCLGIEPDPEVPCADVDDCMSDFPEAFNPDCVGGACGLSLCAEPCVDGECELPFGAGWLSSGECYCFPGYFVDPVDGCEFDTVNPGSGSCVADMTCLGLRPEAGYPCQVDPDCLAFLPESWNPDCVEGACGMSFCADSCMAGACEPGYGPFELSSGGCYCFPAAHATPRLAGEPCTWGLVNALEGLCAEGLRCLGESADDEVRPCPGGPADCAAFYPAGWHPDCELGGCGYSVCAAPCAGGACEAGFEPVEDGGCYCRPAP